MPETVTHLYRFRPLTRLLDDGELRNQEIFFAAPGDLNDPMEGFSDTVWQGDRVVWENLFRHYLLCFARACELLALSGEEHAFGWEHIPISHPDQMSQTPQHQAVHDEMLNQFLGDPIVKEFIDALAARSQPVRRNELAAHIRYLNPFLISVVYGAYERHGLMPNPGLTPEVIANFRSTMTDVSKLAKALKELEPSYDDFGDKIDAFYTSTRHLNEQLDFIHRYNGTIDISKTNKNFVLLEFCDEYVKRIERLLYPDWYAACFMADCKDSSAWGTYGNKHEGVCLIFNVGTKNERPTIRLTRMCGYGSDGPHFGLVEDAFYPITYTRKFVPVDFFRSLGRMTVPVLQRYWYTDRAGNRSDCADAFFENPDAWRKAYWAQFERTVTGKLEDWSREQEYRLVLYGDMLDFSEPAMRKIKYDFADLHGVIFGINTPHGKKREICKIIEEKCREHRRTDFKFYQAYYARKMGTIEHAELRLLKFVE